jgi:hypothetical protein
MEWAIRDRSKELAEILGIHYCDNIQNEVQQMMWTRFHIVFSHLPDYSEEKVEESMTPDSPAEIDRRANRLFGS